MHKRQEFGALAEQATSVFLEKQGYEILDRNYRKPWGEIDIIARKDGVIVFIEVKANAEYSHESFAPQVRADRTKLRKVIKSAMLYLEFELKDLESEWRVDIIAVTAHTYANKAHITHFKNVAEAIQ